jgi:hypothetical protein
MRPIENKVLKAIGKDGITLDGIEEIVDSTNRTELKKSFPDDCHFQSSRYFAKVIADNLVRRRLVTKDGNKFKKPEKPSDKKKTE